MIFDNKEQNKDLRLDLTPSPPCLITLGSNQKKREREEKTKSCEKNKEKGRKKRSLLELKLEFLLGV